MRGAMVLWSSSSLHSSFCIVFILHFFPCYFSSCLVSSHPILFCPFLSILLSSPLVSNCISSSFVSSYLPFLFLCFFSSQESCCVFGHICWWICRVWKPCTHYCWCRHNPSVSSPQISDYISLANNLLFSLFLLLLLWGDGCIVPFLRGDGCASGLWSDARHTHRSTEMREKSILWDNKARAVDLTWGRDEEWETEQWKWLSTRMKHHTRKPYREEKATALMDESHIVPAGVVVLKLHEYLDTLADEHKSNTPNSLTHRLI